MSWKKHILAVILILSVCNAGARSKFVDFTLGMWNKFSAPKPYLDTAWIFQPRPSFDISASYKARWNGIDLDIPYFIEGAEFEGKPISSSVDIKMKLVDRTAHNVGLYVGYGPISLGYSLGIGVNKKINRSFSFDWVSSFYGLQFYYGRFNGQIDATCYEEDNTSFKIPFKSPADVMLIQLDGYYAFNRKKFSYQAAYKGKIIQRKSAGSIMAGVKYLHAGIMFDSEEDVTMGAAFLGMCGYGTDQVSVGAGYSYNFVPFNKDNDSNLTVNLTAIPLLTFVNEIHTVHHSNSDGNKKTFIHGKLQPNFIARAAVSYSVWHLHFCARFDFQYNKFRTDINYTAEDMGVAQSAPNSRIQYSVNGNITNWIAGLDIHYRF